MMNYLQIKTLNNAVLFFAIVVVAAMLLQWIVAPNYAQKNELVLSALFDVNQKVLPWQLEEMIKSGEIANYVIIDLRPAIEYNYGTLPGAVNIPLAQILASENQGTLFKSSKPLLLFSGEEAEAATALFLLMSKGVDNVRIIANNYRFVKENVLENFSPAAAFSQSEKARYDFNRYFRTGGGKSPEAPSGGMPVVPKTEVIQAQGGC
jgi:rhodanese-related sulfurtransferase